MGNKEILKAVNSLKTRFDLLLLLNKIKKDEFSDNAFPFTIQQFNYFSNPKRNSKHYKSFKIPKKSGGYREVCAPEKMLKSMLHCINIMLQALYEPSGAAMGFLPGKSIVDNAKKHVGMNYVLNADMKDFFPSINQPRVWATLQAKPICMSREIASIIAGLCCKEQYFLAGVIANKEDNNYDELELRNVLPQGSPASPILTNIVCRKLDRQLLGLAKRFNLNYTRYADDITFSSMHNVYAEEGEFMQEFKRIIYVQNFRLNEKKTRLQKKGARQEVTGIVVSDKTNVTREYIRDISSLLYIWEHYGYNSAYARFLLNYHPNYKKGTPTMEKVIAGKLLYVKMVKGAEDSTYAKLKTRLDNLCSKLPSWKSDINYIASYTIREFEKLFETEIKYVLKKDADKDMCTTKFYAEFMLGEEKNRMAISQKCAFVLNKLVLNSDFETIEVIKNKYYAVLCESNNGQFWLIMRSMPRYHYEKKQRDIPYTDLMEREVKAEVNNSQFDTGQLLQALIENGFDLKYLEKWDKTKNY